MKITKHGVLRAILAYLGIPIIPEYFSNGSTVTRAGLRRIVFVLDPSKPKDLLKHQALKEIFSLLGIAQKYNYFSKGSTITKDALLIILESLQLRHSHVPAA